MSAPEAARTLRVFLAYRLADDDAVRRLREAVVPLPRLELRELPADRRNAGTWRQTYLDLVARLDALVCFAGPTTAESENVLWELDEAAGRGVPILFAGPASDALAARYPGSRVMAIDQARQALKAATR